MLPLDTKNYFNGTTDCDVLEREKDINIKENENVSSSLNSSRRIESIPSLQRQELFSVIDNEQFEPNREKRQLRAIDSETVERVGTQSKVHVKISSKVKTLIVVYCLALVALIAMMTFSITTLAKLNSKEAELDNSIQKLYVQITEGNSELDGMELSSPSKILEKAVELGMISEEEAARIELEELPYIDSPGNTYVKTWFDNVCDFFSNLFS